MRNIKTSTIFLISIASCLLIILLQIFRWDLVDIFTPFLEPIIELLIIAFFVVSVVQSLIYLFKKVKVLRIKTSTPFIINLITILIVLYVPFVDITLNVDFKWNYQHRAEVVSLVKSGELKNYASGNNDFIKLPDKYHNLSRGGEVVVEKKDDDIKILFYTFRGISDKFSGFVYSTKNEKVISVGTLDHFKQIKKYNDNWFWVSSY